MGLVRALSSTITGGLSDQWLEVLEADKMSDGIVLTKGIKVRVADKRNTNRKGTENYVTDGSIIHVNQNQFMMLVDGGKIVDYTAEAGYFTVDNAKTPSLFSGKFGDAIKETFARFKYGGVTSQKQDVYFVNLQEIKGIKFGTPNPLNYFDAFYNAELFLKAFGNYSIKITDPIKFFKEVCPRDATRLHIDQVNEQYLSEFLQAFHASINKMSADGIRISYMPSMGPQVSNHMAEVLDENWNELRGMEVVSVGVASISYDDASKELINMRNRGAMLSDANLRDGFVQASIAKGLEEAGKNPAGAGMAFMGMGMGMNATSGFVGQAGQSNDQIQKNSILKQENEWFCMECGTKNKGNFCINCGRSKPSSSTITCLNCGFKVESTAKFCPNCGTKIQKF